VVAFSISCLDAILATTGLRFLNGPLHVFSSFFFQVDDVLADNRMWIRPTSKYTVSMILDLVLPIILEKNVPLLVGYPFVGYTADRVRIISIRSRNTVKMIMVDDLVQSTSNLASYCATGGNLSTNNWNAEE